MPELDFRGLDAASQVAFKPHFGEVVRRAARRRRRTRAAGALVVVAALATGTGVATGALHGPGTAAPPVDTPSTPAFIPPAGPSDGPGPAAGHRSQTGAMVAGDLDHLYLSYTDCQRPGVDCAIMLAASDDGGGTWTESALPVEHNSLVMLAALAPRTLLAWVQDGTAVRQYWQASVDGGHTWREVTVRDVDAIPTGWLPVDTSVALDSVGVLAADPATGELVRLAQPRQLSLARLVAGLPPAAGLWVSGFTGTATTPAGTQRSVTGTGSSVEVSHDGGRTWQRRSFPDNLDAGFGFGGAAIASVDGHSAYAVGLVGGTLLVYRTVDGGQTWSRAPAQVKVDAGTQVYASVRADGTLLVQLGTQAGDHPAMYQSSDGGQTLRPVPVGPGAAALAVPGGYAQTGWPNSSGAWLSRYGADWSYVAPPDLP